jgi:hypothetical protein
MKQGLGCADPPASSDWDYSGNFSQIDTREANLQYRDEPAGFVPIGSRYLHQQSRDQEDAPSRQSGSLYRRDLKGSFAPVRGTVIIFHVGCADVRPDFPAFEGMGSVEVGVPG